MFFTHILSQWLYIVAALIPAPGIQALTLRASLPTQLFFIKDLEFSSLPAASSTLNVSFSLQDETLGWVRLHLSRDEGVFAQPMLVNHLRPDGTVRSTNSIPGGNHLAFRGTTFTHSRQKRENGPESKVGWARLTFHVKNGVQLAEGAFSVYGTEYHVHTDYNYRSTRTADDPEAPAAEDPYMLVWRDSPQDSHAREERAVGSEAACGVDSLDFNHVGLESSTRSRSIGFGLDARQNGGLDSLDLTDVIGSTTGCPKTRMIALLGIATDCSYTAQFQSTDDLRQHVLAQINTASQLYEQSLNVSLRVQNLTISDASCPGSSSSSPSWNRACDSGTTIGDRLGLFSDWRQGVGADGNAVWTLLTTCSSGATVGIAWIGTVCRGAISSGRGGSSSPNTNVVARTGSEWQTIAHEIGHNFGASHDCTSGCSTTSSQRCCPFSRNNCDAGGAYIMNPASSSAMDQFSPCTIGTICTAMGRDLIQTNCLSGNGNVTTLSEGNCGNGLVEPGEECDCGGVDGCGSNSCCDPSSCTFVTGAVCDPSTDSCCTSQCQPSTSGSCGESTDNEDNENNSVGSWIERNRTLFIIICVVGGVFVLLAVVVLCTCLGRKKKPTTQQAPLRHIQAPMQDTAFSQRALYR